MKKKEYIHNTDKRIVIVVGHYGSGKTEFATNYAIQKASSTKMPLYLADLDIVNLYFRSSEIKEILQTKNVHIIESTVTGGAADLPSLKAALYAHIHNTASQLVLDVGGNAVGAKILQQYQKNLQPFTYDMFLIINANRIETKTLENVMHFMYTIEAESGLRITGLVNNTHLLKETSLEDIERGTLLVQQVASKTGLPIVYECAPRQLVIREKKEALFPLDLYMRTDWMT